MATAWVWLLWATLIAAWVGARGTSGGSSISDVTLAPALQNFFRELRKQRRRQDRDDEDEAEDEDPSFLSVWERSPRLWRNVRGVPGLFCFSDAVEGAAGGLLTRRASIARSEEASAGRWVSDFVPPTTRTRDDLRAALGRGTVFFNGAGLDYPNLAALASCAQHALGLPVNVNVNMTQPGRDVSVSPHTDAQNVLVFQTQGRKRWRVWAPPRRIPGKDPFGRGKNGDKIEALELGTPLVDTWLEPGSVLYVPIGFPHATSTVAEPSNDVSEDDFAGCGSGSDDDDDAKISCHATLGLDTYFYGLSFATLRALSIVRAGYRDALNLFELDDNLHAQLFAPLPFGFLCPEHLQGDDYGELFENYILAELGNINDQIKAACGGTPPSLGSEESIRHCVRFLINHWRTVTASSKYTGVSTPPKLGTVASMQARALRDSKNQREEAAQKSLAAFARPRA